MANDGVSGVNLQEAGKAVAFYWGGAMVGRAIGSGLLAKFDAPRLLAFFTAVACALCLYVFAFGGVSGGFVALGIGLFNSIMFPVIFTITLDRSSASEEATSGLLCTAIVGGAFVPLLVGAVADRAGYIAAFLVPAACYAVLWLFAVSAGRVRPRREAEALVAH
jgi:FHS family L-fucose permease-like MFS transporter